MTFLSVPHATRRGISQLSWWINICHCPKRIAHRLEIRIERRDICDDFYVQRPEIRRIVVEHRGVVLGRVEMVKAVAHALNRGQVGRTYRGEICAKCCYIPSGKVGDCTDSADGGDLAGTQVDDTKAGAARLVRPANDATSKGYQSSCEWGNQNHGVAEEAHELPCIVEGGSARLPVIRYCVPIAE